VLNDGRLTLGDGSKMKLDVDPFLVSLVDLEEKKITVHSGQASTIWGKNVIVSDELKHQMMVPHNPEVGAWKENTSQRYSRRVKPTPDILIDKYIKQQQQWCTNGHQTGFRGESQPSYQQTSPRHNSAWGLRAVKGFTKRVYHGRSGRDSELRKEVQPISLGCLDRDAMMIGSVPCKLSPMVHVNG
jgi:hypothetical protein